VPVRFRFDFEKAVAALHYLASSKIKSLDKYKACKLIFLADKDHLVRFGRPITGDRINALDYGPVPSNVLNVLNAFLKGDSAFQAHSLAELRRLIGIDRSFHNPHFLAIEKADFNEFLSPSDIAALERTIAEYGSRSFNELKAITHEMLAYRNARTDAPNNAPEMAYEDLFEEDGDAIEGALEEMQDNYALRQAFGGSV
jgi:uncharacterized phage-associated protein